MRKLGEFSAAVFQRLKDPSHGVGQTFTVSSLRKAAATFIMRLSARVAEQSEQRIDTQRNAHGCESPVRGVNRESWTIADKSQYCLSLSETDFISPRQRRIRLDLSSFCTVAWPATHALIASHQAIIGHATACATPSSSANIFPKTASTVE